VNQLELCQAFAARCGAAAVITSPGSPAYELWALRPDLAALHQMELGYATAIALGIALGDDRGQAAAVEGDGSMLAGLPVLAAIGREQPPNLVIVVVDNQQYAAVQSPRHPPFPTATAAGTDLEAVGRACGITRAVTVRDRATADTALAKAFATPGPWLIVAKVLDRSPLPPLEPEDPRRRDGHKPDVLVNGLQFQELMRSRAAANGHRARGQVAGDDPPPGETGTQPRLRQ
jgi:thiamine pyrophosphate-dependent acetolactate synthase large subunit-like protein